MFGDMSIKRYLWLHWLRLYKNRLTSDRRIRRPAEITNQEKTLIEIFMKVLHNPNSQLFYDIQTSECYLKSEELNLFIFLEMGNVKVINSVFGYDVNINPNVEDFLIDRFKREMNVRRMSFKKEALSKIQHSLGTTLDKIVNK